jgi:hypothetical protein
MPFALLAHALLYPAPTITAGVMRYVEITPYVLSTVSLANSELLAFGVSHRITGMRVRHSRQNRSILSIFW